MIQFPTWTERKKGKPLGKLDNKSTRKQAGNIDEVKLRALVAEAGHSRRTWPTPVRIGALAAAAGLAALALLPFVEISSDGTGAPAEPPSRALVYEVRYPASAAPGAPPSPPEELKTQADALLVRIGGVDVGLDAASRVEVIQAKQRLLRLKLVAGRLGIALPLSGERPAQMKVEAGEFVISVTGTQFLIHKDSGTRAVRVAVRRGVVRVGDTRGRSWEVSAGRTLFAGPDGEVRVGDLDRVDDRLLTELLDPSERSEATQGAAAKTQRQTHKTKRPAVHTADPPPDIAEIKRCSEDPGGEGGAAGMVDAVPASPLACQKETPITRPPAPRRRSSEIPYMNRTGWR